jgi:hypothetical protein
MGGQACVLYGAAEYSRDLDVAVLATPDSIASLRGAMDELNAEVIAVPPFHAEYLLRGHAVHFSVPATRDSAAAPLRVDVMATMRGVAPFDEIWLRRTTVAVDDELGNAVEVDIMSLPDLVQAKKTQRDKDWPMIRRLVDASYAATAEHAEATEEQIGFWLRELRTPEFLRDAVQRFSTHAQASTRDAVHAARTDGHIDTALDAEREREVSLDREYWAPLRQELELLRQARRRGEL